LKKPTRKAAPALPGRRESRIQHLTDLHLTYEGDKREIAIRPPDLSVHGMFVNTSTHFPEGAIVNLRFCLTRSKVKVQTRGEVRYCLPGIGVGIEFLELGTEAVRAIDKELRFFHGSRRPKSRPGEKQSTRKAV